MAGFPALPPLPFQMYIANNMEAGKVTSPAKGWVRVNFKQPFLREPVVVALMPYKEGWFTPPAFSLPKTSASKVTAFSVPVPRIQDILVSTREDFKKKVALDFQNKFKELCGDWGVLNWLRDRFSVIFYWIGYVAGAAMNYMWDIMIKPKIDELAENVESALRGAVENLVYRVNSSIMSLVSSTNQSLESASKALSEAVEKAIEEWYRAMGYEKGQLPQFALVRNVSESGFEVWIPTPLMPVYYVAVGVR